MAVVDLHVHSTASDGEYEPAAVVRRAAKLGLAAIALTDHDTIAGLPDAIAAGAALGVEVITGCEFSVAAHWGEMHLLAYFLPAEDGRLSAYLEEQRAKRVERAWKIVVRLNSLGIDVTLDEVMVAADGGAVGRPHVARVLVARGVVPDVDAAFRKYLGWRRPAFVPKNLPPIAEVTALVRGLGGVTSAAHLKDRATRSTLRKLRAVSLDGVEVRHPMHDEVTARRILQLVEELHLLPTGGSDWHGDGQEPADRASLGELGVPEAWLTAIQELHQQRISPSEAVT